MRKNGGDNGGDGKNGGEDRDLHLGASTSTKRWTILIRYTVRWSQMVVSLRAVGSFCYSGAVPIVSDLRRLG